MKHTFLTITLCMVALLAIPNDIQSQLYENPIHVILYNDDPAYNSGIQQAINKYWSLNNYQFVTEEEFNNLKKENANLFLIKNESQSVEEGTLVYDEVIRIVQFSKGGKMITQVAGTPVIKKDEDDSSISYVNAVLGLQDKVQFEISKSENNSTFNSYSDKVKNRTNIVKLKTLYIADEDIKDGLTVEMVNELYSGELVVLSRSELADLINSQSNIVYAVVNNKPTSGFTYVNTKQIIDASNGQVLFKNESTTIKPEGFSKKDWKKLAD